MLCAVYTVHKETIRAGFFVWPQNKGRRFLPVWPQNRWLWVSRFGHQNRQLQFGDFGLKIIATVSWFGHQNQVGYSLSVAPQNRREDKDNVGCVLRSSGLLRVEASRARVSQSGLKTGGGATRMVHMASSRRLRGSEAEDGRFDGVRCGAVQVERKYPSLDVIFLLTHRGILVFWFSL
jgi:hypothetical protein